MLQEVKRFFSPIRLEEVLFVNRSNGRPSGEECQPCPAGRWTDQKGTTSASACFECPAGRWSGAIGAAQDRTQFEARCGAVREPGKFSDEGAESCSLCYAGSWSASSGATGNESHSCTPCAAGRYVALEGQTEDTCPGAERRTAPRNGSEPETLDMILLKKADP
eukprot:g650.t1